MEKSLVKWATHYDLHQEGQSDHEGPKLMLVDKVWIAFHEYFCEYIRKRTCYKEGWLFVYKNI